MKMYSEIVLDNGNVSISQDHTTWKSSAYNKAKTYGSLVVNETMNINVSRRREMQENVLSFLSCSRQCLRV